MPAYTTQDIRNLALVGSAGCGKTSLAEALLYGAGAVGSPGSVERGDTVCDFDPLEQRHHHSLNTAIVALDYRGRHINLIDTPGYPDFVGQTLSSLPAVETVAVVIDAQAGIQPMTRRMMESVAALHMCCMIIVNKIDTDPDHLAELMGEIRAAFGKECLALNLPADHGTRVIDCLHESQGTSDFSTPGGAHTALLDQVVEVDEDIMTRYLEQGDVDEASLHAPFEQALREGHLIPVCFVSARTGTGIAELLDVLAEWAPNPREGGGHGVPAAAQSDAAAEADGPLLAHVFKVEFDPFVGKLGVFRIHQGTIHKGSQLLIDDAERAYKVSHLYRLIGKEHIEVEEGIPGDIVAVAKVDEVHVGALLHDTHEQQQVRIETPPTPMPLMGLALEPHSRGDEQKVSDVLARLAAEDPCLQVEHDVDHNEVVLRGLGDLHLRVALEKMEQRYQLHVSTHPPSIPYRETITQAAQGHHRHKKQTGGAGQFGEVFLEVEPLPAGAGFEFVDRVTGGAIPSQFIPAVEKGVRQAMRQGAVAGCPMQDIRVTVYDGKHHAVDSKEVAFVAAGRKAFLDAVDKAGPIVLEPMVDLKVVAPADCVGDITGDLASRRARINASDSDGARAVITAVAPLAELADYAPRLTALTSGQGSFELSFSHYDPAPHQVQTGLTQQRRQHH